jgi:hypothetical protein
MLCGHFATRYFPPYSYQLQFNLQENFKKSATASLYKLLQQMSKNVKHTAGSHYVVKDSQIVAQDFQQWSYMRKLYVNSHSTEDKKL